MVVKANGFRSFRRTHRGVLIYLQLTDWPTDVPLPQGAMLGETGEGPFFPYCDLILKNDQTIQAIVGWFIIPMALSETIAWYQDEMTKSGWEEMANEGYRTSSSAAVHFRRVDPDVRTVVGLRMKPSTRQTDALIRRIVVHPWTPAAAEPLEPAAESA